MRFNVLALTVLAGMANGAVEIWTIIYEPNEEHKGQRLAEPLVPRIHLCCIDGQARPFDC